MSLKCQYASKQLTLTTLQELPNLPKPTAAIDAAKNGLEFFEKLQLPSGHWACEYGGPLFLLPSIVIAWYVTKTPIPEAYAVEMKRYLTERANATDGGWGLYVGDESTTFGTTLNYVLLRLIGVESDDPVMVRARGSLYKLGGALYAPDWAKFWLATLGVVSWDLVNPIPPEAWLLPDWVPFAPWRWWVHTRQVFLPMSYIYSRKWQYPEDDVIRGLKVELFTEDLTTINWESYRNSIDPRDNSYPRSWLLNTMNWAIVNLYNPVRPNFLKDKGEAWVSELIDMEDANTDYVDLGPVNASVNTIVCYIRDGPEASSTMRHLQKLQEFLWVNNEGLLANGTNGLQCWDTAFLLRAVYKAGLHRDKQWRPTMLRALDFLERQQIRENCIDQEKCYRQPRKGGWPFSNREQGYPVSDCIAEAMSSIILFQKTDGYPTLVEDGRIYDAVDLLLQYQNSSGGLGSYEATRGGKYMELLNGSTVFGRIMIEYDYPECTGACITALSLFNTHWPNYRSKEIKLFLNRAIKWIHSNQLPDGSWYGSWGICFTYATMFALESLASMGEMYDNSDVSKRGCQFLLSKQREDGGWSESYKVCFMLKQLNFRQSLSCLVLTIKIGL